MRVLTPDFALWILRSMRNRRGASVLRSRSIHLLLAAIALVCRPSMAEIPAAFAATDSAGRAAWVPAEMAVEDGRVLPGLFDPAHYLNLQDMLEAARSYQDPEADDPCDVVTMATSSAPGESAPPRSPTEFARSAGFIVRGTVRDEESGFYEGTPGTMYELAVEEVLKGPGQGRSTDYEPLYFFYRTAAIPVGDVTLCYHAARGMERPLLGGEVLLLLGPGVVSSDQVIVPLDHQILFEGRGGSVSAPDRYPNVLRNLPEFTQDLKARLREAQ